MYSIKHVLASMAMLCLVAPSLFSQTVWERVYSREKSEYFPYSIELENQDIIITSYSKDTCEHDSAGLWVTRADANGDIIWTKSFKQQEMNSSYSVIETQSGDIIIAGFTWDSPWFEDLYVLSLDGSGNLNWQNSYAFSGTSYHERGFDIIESQASGELIVTGYTGSFGPGWENVMLVSLDQGSGSVNWANAYGSSGTFPIGSDRGGNVVESPTGAGYFISGNTNGFGVADRDVYLLRTFAGGGFYWSATYGDAGFEEAYMTDCHDGNLLLGGWTTSSGAGLEDVFIMKVDTHGNPLWQYTYGGGRNDRAYQIKETDDHGAIVVGYSNSWGMHQDDYDIYIIRVDPDGGVMWSNVYGGRELEQGYSIELTDDGGFLVSGHTNSFGSGDQNQYVLKIEPDGSTCSCHWRPVDTEQIPLGWSPDYVTSNTASATLNDDPATTEVVENPFNYLHCIAAMGTTSPPVQQSGNGTLAPSNGLYDAHVDAPANLQHAGAERLESLKPAELVVFPNPGRDVLSVAIDEKMLGGSISQAQILDVSGRVVWQQGQVAELKQIDISALENGVYLLEVVGQNGERQSQQLVIEK